MFLLLFKSTTHLESNLASPKLMESVPVNLCHVAEKEASSWKSVDSKIIEDISPL